MDFVHNLNMGILYNLPRCSYQIASYLNKIINNFNKE